MQRMLSILLSLAILGPAQICASEHSVGYSETPDWVKQQTVPPAEAVPFEKLDGGYYHLLVDDQIRAGGNHRSEYYVHLAQYVANRSGLEASSQISIEFDPEYESLELHSLRVIRGDQIIDRLRDTELKMLQRESDLDDAIIDGRLTASMILDDIRVGDIVEYSYTISGDNPVYQGIFAFNSLVQWSVPVARQHLRVLWSGPEELNITYHNTDQRFSRVVHDQHIEYDLGLDAPPMLPVDSERPGWHVPFGRVFLSQTSDWREIVEWGLPLYESAIDTGGDIAAIAQEIARDHTRPDQQISAALAKVQTHVRYFGIEIGINSHQPSPAAETLKRRFGDCKDKAVLLVSILRNLGIQASPALVNSRRTRLIAKYPPMVTAFDHVIVKVTHEGQAYWLDPTREFQQGELARIYQPNYGYALVIDNASSALEPIQFSAAQSQEVINEYFDLTAGPEGPTMLHVESVYSGRAAESRHNNLAEYGAQSIQDDYLNYYRGNYGAIEIDQKMRVEDQDNGELKILEDYQMTEFWEKQEDKRKFLASFYAPSVNALVPKPDQTERSAPYHLGTPLRFEQKIEIKLDNEDWKFEGELIEESNQFFDYRFQAEYDVAQKLLVLSYRLQRLSDHVPAEKIDAYLSARDIVLDSTTYSIQKGFATQSTQHSQTELDPRQRILLVYLSLLAIGLAFVITNWRLAARKRKRSEEAGFFRVSLPKLFLLSLVTHGFYTSYWFYRNWLYIKQRDSSHLMPIARGIFSIFWYYPFAEQLINDSVQRYEQNRLFPKPVAALLAIVYLGMAVPFNQFEQLYLPLLVVYILLVFPLANYINHITQDDKDLDYASWLPRHTVTLVTLIPALLFVTASSISILPGNTAIRGDRLWQADIKFMQRNKVFPAKENLLWFYSDAFFSIRDDGNGFTEERVFSYWVDDQKNLNVETAEFDEIKKIDINSNPSVAETASVTVTRDDDSHFVLYVGPSNNRGRQSFVTELKQRWRQAESDSD